MAALGTVTLPMFLPGSAPQPSLLLVLSPRPTLSYVVMFFSFRRRGGSARGRAIPRVGAVDCNDTTSTATPPQELTAQRGPAGKPDPTAQRDPAGKPDPTAQRDPAAKPDPTAQRDPAAKPDLTAQPGAAVQPGLAVKSAADAVNGDKQKRIRVSFDGYVHLRFLVSRLFELKTYLPA